MSLDSPIESEFRLQPTQKAALKKLGIKTIEDLLYHFPARYGNTSEVRMIESVGKGDTVTLYGKVSGLQTSKAFIKKIPMSEGVLEDESGRVKLVWFNQPYIAKMVHDGQLVRVEGRVSERKNELYLSNPKIERVDSLPAFAGESLFGSVGDSHALHPIYPESRGITSNWFYHAIKKTISSSALGNFGKMKEVIPEEILEKYNLPHIRTAMIWIHAPKNESDALAARKRFAFQEIFLIQLEKQKQKKEWRDEKSFVVKPAKIDVGEFLDRFPFEPTESQLSAIDSILSDFSRGYPMSRLLEGDVGSGKTAVAAATVFAVTKTRPFGKDFGNLQTAYMCPTEILARQHYDNFISYFRHLPIKIGLVTGSECKIFPSKSDSSKPTHISKSQLLKWVANGEVPILIGTHALIQKSVSWKHLSYVIIDEQHRFGTAQRQKLTQKGGITPHLLTMTATPIPRTLALTMYGDLDLTLLEGMPHGRKPIITKIVGEHERGGAYEQMRVELRAGRQLYVICPRIDEPDPDKELALLAKSVKAESARLKKEIFQEFSIDILHSKMTPQEKEKVMKKFESGETKILVATSVVEVGVNVPNATMIVIEGAERFGLSQLHQLRGRVIRSNHQAYCFVFAESRGQKTRDRLKALLTAKNGFELAEFDLSQRGAGALSGEKQWGISDIAMDALRNLKLVEFAREEAARLIEEDSDLKKYPLLAEYLQKNNKIHFE